MAPRQTARRLLVAAPALALALGVTACSPPNEQPADPDAPYTLPSFSEDPEPPTTTPLAPESAGGVDEAEEQWLEGTPTPTTDPGLGLFGDPVGVDEAEGVDGPVVPDAERQPGDIANN
ncbi:MAG TPA: hypothetical protein H9755_07205 [Candidatus Dietzia intestinigallinarum]|nr:hypothetical protein [Candidatus Dietzia intestinigallinarum]